MSKRRKDFTDFIGDTSRKHWVAESMMEADEYNRRNRDDSSFSFYDDLDEFGEDRNADLGFSDDYDDDFDDSDDDYGFSQDDDDSDDGNDSSNAYGSSYERSYRRSSFYKSQRNRNTSKSVRPSGNSNQVLSPKTRQTAVSRNAVSFGKREDTLWRTTRMNEALQYGLSIFGFKTEDEFDAAVQKKKAASQIAQNRVTQGQTASTPRFPVENYADEYYGFAYHKAVANNLRLPEGIDREDLDDCNEIDDLVNYLARVDAEFAFKAWKWCFKTFWPYCQDNRHLLDRIIGGWSYINDDFIKQMIEELDSNDTLCQEIFLKDSDETDKTVYMIFDILEQRKDELAVKIYKAYCKHPKVKEKDIFELLDSLVYQCTESQNARLIYSFVEHILSLTDSLPQAKVKWRKKEWAEQFEENGFSLDLIEKQIHGEENHKRPEDWMLDYWDRVDGFDYGKMIAEKMNLPANVNGKTVKEQYILSQLFHYLSKKDLNFAFEAWKWCYDTVWPYSEHSRDFFSSLISDWYEFGADLTELLLDEIAVNPQLRGSLLSVDEEAKHAAHSILYGMLRRNKGDEAVELYCSYLDNPNITEDDVADTLDYLLHDCKYCDDSLPMRLFHERIMPLIDEASCADAACNKAKWLEEVECYFSKKGETLDEEPAEEEQLEEQHEELAERLIQHVQEHVLPQIAEEEEDCYRFVGVIFSEDGPVYSYRCDDRSITVGDSVMVETTRGHALVEVVSVTDCRRMAAPYPVDKAKFILKKMDV